MLNWQSLCECFKICKILDLEISLSRAFMIRNAQPPGCWARLPRPASRRTNSCADVFESRCRRVLLCCSSRSDTSRHCVQHIIVNQVTGTSFFLGIKIPPRKCVGQQELAGPEVRVSCKIAPDRELQPPPCLFENQTRLECRTQGFSRSAGRSVNSHSSPGGQSATHKQSFVAAHLFLEQVCEQGLF